MRTEGGRQKGTRQSSLVHLSFLPAYAVCRLRFLMDQGSIIVFITTATHDEATRLADMLVENVWLPVQIT